MTPKEISEVVQGVADALTPHFNRIIKQEVDGRLKVELFKLLADSTEKELREHIRAALKRSLVVSIAVDPQIEERQAA